MSVHSANPVVRGAGKGPITVSNQVARQTALERQDLSCTYLAHHDLESKIVNVTAIKPCCVWYRHKVPIQSAKHVVCGAGKGSPDEGSLGGALANRAVAAVPRSSSGC